ncbi:hypothetical protein Tco_0482430 [Tanacetum coccineum]
MERFLQPTNDPLALVSNASVQQYPTQSNQALLNPQKTSPLTTLSTRLRKFFNRKTSIESLSTSLCPPHFNRTIPSSSNKQSTRTSVLMQEQSYVLIGKGTPRQSCGSSMSVLDNNANNQGKPFRETIQERNVVAANVREDQKEEALLESGQSDFKIPILNFQDIMLLNASPENGAVLRDKKHRCFLAAGRTVTNIDKDVIIHRNDLVTQCGDQLKADELCILSNSIWASYDPNTPFVSNIIPMISNVEDNEEHVVQSNVSSVRDDALMSILNEMHEQGVQSRLENKPNMVVKDSVTFELARYKELSEDYEQTGKVSQILHSSTVGIKVNRQKKLTILKKGFLNKEVTTLKKDFKQKEDKYIEEFLDIKKLKEKVEDRLFKQDQSVQTVYMLRKPKPFYDEKKKVAIGYKNLLCLICAKQVQSALYNGTEIVMTNHKPAVVHDSEETLEIAELIRTRMHEKMKSPQYIQNKVKFAPPDYSKENYLAIFAPQRDLTPEHIFWAKDENDMKKVKASVLKQLSTSTVDSVKPKVLAPDMYAIDVKPIPHPLKNNKSAHLNYISHFKESVEIVREIIEEARVVKPLDKALNYACQYTKLSQELLEYVIGTCPKSFNERDNKAPSTPVTRKKKVTFNDKPGTSSSNTQKHEVHKKVQQTNIPVIHSTGVNTSTEASGSKPRSNTKKNRILPAKSENKKKVEDHTRTNKSVWTKVNRVDSSISSKLIVINSNSESVCKTSNKWLNSANHEMCVVNILSYVNATPTVKIVLNKGKQIWKPKGKLSDNSLNKTKRVWKAMGKLFADIGYQ